MSFGVGLKTFLNAAPQIAGGRITPLRLPRGWKAIKGQVAVTYERSGGGPLQTFDGPTGNDRPTVGIHVWGHGYTETETEAKAIKNKMDGYAGLMGTVTVSACRLTAEHELTDPDTQAFHRVLEFLISYEEE